MSGAGADVAQRVLLHQLPRQVGRALIAAAAARIGGDLYDVVAVQGTTRLIVADVQGKGLAAVQTAWLSSGSRLKTRPIWRALPTMSSAALGTRHPRRQVRDRDHGRTAQHVPQPR
jgi:hypothetical protein